ncbi:SigE family RNA polymerase sigma factor [Nocardioides sp.]|uniref:SigE family RNA polymerase sigma factor n=1 Tax=Nocardioides sp. TaxID=35761 RepID=UPI002735826C|nr:SigE family RNA polymerase sigma factor [Nocardioides sp.]MDP3891655.1 SigE family RNA polymerase sigma factor [Nocardioides sp.]
MQTITEAAVPTSVQASTRDAEFTAYMNARQPSLLRTAYLLTGDRHTAEDLVQTALAKLYLSWDKVQRRELIDGYVRRILVNENNSLWRRAWKRRELASDELPEVPRHDEYDDGRSRALWEFVQSLPHRQRAVIVLRYYEELSEAEIADALGVSVGTVKSQASRALAALRDRAPDHLRLHDGEEER